MTDREKLMSLIWHKQDCGLTGQDFVTYNAELADHLIAHGVTVRERGRWIDANGIRKSKCNVCGVGFGRVMGDDCHFCPTCGADMR